MVVESKIHSGVSLACTGEYGMWIATRENGCNQSP